MIGPFAMACACGQVAPSAPEVIYTLHDEEGGRIIGANTDGRDRREMGRDGLYAPASTHEALAISVQERLDSTGAGVSGLALVDAGGDVRVVTAAECFVGNLDWAPDGKHIAFVETCGDAPLTERTHALRTCPQDGIGCRTVARGPMAGFWWSPDSSLLAYVSSLGESLHVVSPGDTSGTALFEQTDSPALSVSNDQTGTQLHVRWSPDGEHLAFFTTLLEDPAGVNTTQRLHVWTKGSRAPLVVAEHASSERWLLSFSPDGAYVAWVPWNESPAIWMVRPDGSDSRQIQLGQANGRRPAYSWTWAPGGHRILYLLEGSAGAFEWHLADIDANTDGALSHLGSSLIASWSPHGDRIVHRLTNAQGENEIHLAEVTEPIDRIVHTGSNVGAVSWTPSGERLVVPSGARGLVLNREGGLEATLDLATGESRQIDWSHDGRLCSWSSEEVSCVAEDGSRRHSLWSGGTTGFMLGSVFVR